MTWPAWACWRATTTDAPHLASSQYRLERLRADMTLSLRFLLNFGHKEPVLFCTFQCPNITCPRRTLGRCSATWHNLIIQAIVGSLSYTPKLVLWGTVSLTRPSMALVEEGFSYTSRASFSSELYTCIVTLVLLRSLPYTSHASFSGSFSYTSRVSFSEESLLHSLCCFQWTVVGSVQPRMDA